MPYLVWVAVAANLGGALLIISGGRLSGPGARSLHRLALILFVAASGSLALAAFQIEAGIGMIILLAAAVLNALLPWPVRYRPEETSR